MITTSDIDALRAALTAQSVPMASTLALLTRDGDVPSSYWAGYMAGYVHAADTTLDALDRMTRNALIG